MPAGWRGSWARGVWLGAVLSLALAGCGRRATPVTPVTLRSIAQAGGAGGPLAVGDGVAYAVFGDRLSVVAVADPARARLQGQSGPLGSATSLAAVDGFVYVATPLRLAVLDARDPRQPREVAAFPWSAPEILLVPPTSRGRPPFLLLRAGPGHAQDVRVFDLSVPDRPRPAGQLRAGAPVVAIALWRSMVVAAVAGQGLRLVDPANATFGADTSPLIAADPSVLDVAVAGDRAFTATVRNGRAGVEVWLLTPDGAVIRPRSEGFVPLAATADAPIHLLGATNALGFAQVQSGNDESPTTRVVQVTASTGRPGELGAPRAVRWADAIAPDGDHLVVADGQVGVRIQRAADLTPAGELGLWRTPGLPQMVASANDTVYVGAVPKTYHAGVGGLRILAAAANGPPLIAGAMDGIYPLRDVVADNQFVHLLTEPLEDTVEHWVSHIDARVPAAPRKVNTTDAFDVWRIGAQGNLMAGVGGGPGLQLWDLSRTGQDSRLGDPRNQIRGGHMAVVSAGLVYVLEFDATGHWLNPRRGFSLAIYQPAGQAPIRRLGVSGKLAADHPTGREALAVEGGHAYVAGPDIGFNVFAVGDPAHPQHIGHVDLPSGAAAIAIADGRAYIAAQSAGVIVVDLSDPRRPRMAGRSADCPAQGVAVAHGDVYCAGGKAGLWVLRPEVALPRR
jgi:hypothetical protein